MAKKQVEEVQENTTEETAEVYNGNVYEFWGGITVSNNSGPVTINVKLAGVPNNPPPNPPKP